MQGATHRCRPEGCRVPQYSDGCENVHTGACCRNSFCGLKTYAASHAATLIPFALGVVISFYGFYRRQTAPNEQVLAVSVGLTAFVALVFYFFSFLVVEERHTWKLQVLRRWARVAEVLIRVGILAWFIERLGRIPTEQTLDVAVAMVAVTYALFVGWDLLLIWAPRDNTAQDFRLRSNQLMELANRFLFYDALLLLVAMIVMAGYHLGSLVVLVVCSMVSGVIFASWVGSAREDLKEVGRRVRRLEFR